jgi:hypothetical protein
LWHKETPIGLQRLRLGPCSAKLRPAFPNQKQLVGVPETGYRGYKSNATLSADETWRNVAARRKLLCPSSTNAQPPPLLVAALFGESFKISKSRRSWMDSATSFGTALANRPPEPVRHGTGNARLGPCGDVRLLSFHLGTDQPRACHFMRAGQLSRHDV